VPNELKKYFIRAGEKMSVNVFERPSLTEIAYEQIKKSICLGKFGPGHKLVVDDLVKAYNISNTPIKEALNRLAAEGLVEPVLRRGMQVKKMGPKEINEMNDMRIMYETYCAKKAVQVIDDREDVKAKLSEALQAFEELIGNHSAYDYASHTKVDEEFHLAFISLSGNDALMKEYQKLKSIQMAINNYAYRDLPLKRCEAALMEHKAIYEALMKKEPAQLVESIEKHISNVNNDMLRFINKMNNKD